MYSEYFKHMYSNHFENKHSLLGKIYGMFKIEMPDKNDQYFLAMENLFFGLDMNNQKIYDLKGSKTNRYDKKDFLG